MKKKIDRDMPIGKLTRVDDFLPPPAELAVWNKTTKVTIALERSSVEFFKQEARKHHTKYQRMIREVLDRYASRYRAA
ncbi:MAG: CopG family transcriptional regulator [Candidatus Omnitrophica bacterium]|nr:CopG family transcriptional regulator [Candidatus Omnitrophota bacterium]